MAHSSLGGMCKRRRGVGKIPARAQPILLVLNAFQMYLKAPEGRGVQSHCNWAAGSHLLLSQASKGERIWSRMIFFPLPFPFLGLKPALQKQHVHLGCRLWVPEELAISCWAQRIPDSGHGVSPMPGRRLESSGTAQTVLLWQELGAATGAKMVQVPVAS